ncbi:hypothetical protein LWI29_006656 [Acer saccharum]|uniref:Uncharacterized protein n=1 Tax=Acer saccharum TaxID=4024 RepID=A0AA39RCH4_ACESA|nr:hypothetical protein LWI29_006656 [Acer saccharum]
MEELDSGEKKHGRVSEKFGRLEESCGRASGEFGRLEESRHLVSRSGCMEAALDPMSEEIVIGHGKDTHCGSRLSPTSKKLLVDLNGDSNMSGKTNGPGEGSENIYRNGPKESCGRASGEFGRLEESRHLCLEGKHKVEPKSDLGEKPGKRKGGILSIGERKREKEEFKSLETGVTKEDLQVPICDGNSMEIEKWGGDTDCLMDVNKKMEAVGSTSEKDGVSGIGNVVTLGMVSNFSMEDDQLLLLVGRSLPAYRT